MKLKKYIENLQKLAQDNPSTLEMEVVYSKDDEGNGYSGVYYEPSIGHYDSDEREFTAKDLIDGEPEEYDEDIKMNSICIN